jgi:hypothetical protein
MQKETEKQTELPEIIGTINIVERPDMFPTVKRKPTEQQPEPPKIPPA